MAVETFVALGSNLGDRARHLSAGHTALGALGALRGFSPVFETPPEGPSLYPFLNAVARLETPLLPHVLLDALLAIEAKRGRVRGQRWGPRELNLDILTYDALCLHDARLVLPHPEIRHRAFVLAPWVCLAPQALVGGQSVLDLWHALSAPSVNRYHGTDVPAPYGYAFEAPPGAL